MKRQQTLCDKCGNEINLDHGAVVDILEECHNLNRVARFKDRIQFDLCDACYRPIAEVIRPLEDRRIRSIIASKSAGSAGREIEEGK